MKEENCNVVTEPYDAMRREQRIDGGSLTSEVRGQKGKEGK